jgi:hypothetical protein
VSLQRCHRQKTNGKPLWKVFRARGQQFSQIPAVYDPASEAGGHIAVWLGISRQRILAYQSKVVAAPATRKICAAKTIRRIENGPVFSPGEAKLLSIAMIC